MGWTTYAPMNGSKRPVVPGTCTVDKSGHARIPTADLIAVGIDGQRVTVLHDAANRMIGLRAPREGEPTVSLKLYGKGGVRKASGTVAIPKVVLLCGFADVAAAKGVYETMAKKDGLLVILLNNRVDGSKGK